MKRKEKSIAAFYVPLLNQILEFSELQVEGKRPYSANQSRTPKPVSSQVSSFPWLLTPQLLQVTREFDPCKTGPAGSGKTATCLLGHKSFGFSTQISFSTVHIHQDSKKLSWGVGIIITLLVSDALSIGKAIFFPYVGRKQI